MSLKELEEVNEQIKVLKARRKNLFTESVLLDVAEPLFVFPGINNISFATYVPSFNDGDPCEFSITESTFNVDEDGYDEGEYTYTLLMQIRRALGKERESMPDVYRGNSRQEAEWLEYIAEQKQSGNEWINLGWTEELVNEFEVVNKAFNAFLYDNEEVIEEVYGWPYRFVITTDGLEQHDYDCGY